LLSQVNFPWIIFMPIGAIVFFICILAELERIPFDLPEAESEIVAGWLTELSGMMYGLVQLGSYLKLYAFAALFVVLFLGGWNGPWVYPIEPMAEVITDGIVIMPDALVIKDIPGLPLLPTGDDKRNNLVYSQNSCSNLFHTSSKGSFSTC